MDTSILDQWSAIDGEDYAGVSLPTNVPTDSEISSSSITGGGSSPLNYAPNVLQAGGSILSGIGGYMQGQEEAGAYEYNANLALVEGQFQVDEIGSQEEETLSTQKAMYAKAGVEQSGSVLDMALSTATQYEYSKQVAQYNAQSQANMDEYEAKMAKSQGQFSLAEGLLGGAADIAKLA